MRFREFKPLKESVFGTKRSAKIGFSKSTMDSPHVLDIIMDVHKQTGVPVDELKKKMQESMKNIEELSKIPGAGELYETILENAAANAAFELIEFSSKKINKSAVSLDNRENLNHLAKLCKLIKEENQAFFAIRAPNDIRGQQSLRPILIPDDLYPEHTPESVPLAMVTPKGEFVFNKEFLEHLLYYGAVEKVVPTEKSDSGKPIGKKYKRWGGDIPDNFCYVEFILLHEILHYAYGDFQQGERFSHIPWKALNFMFDLKNNAHLVNAGYKQPPIGLYSDKLNTTQIGLETFSEFSDKVMKILNKLPPKLRAWVTEKTTDTHPPTPPPPPPGPPWKPEVGDILLHQDINGNPKLVKVEKVYNDEEYEVREITKQEKEDFEKEIGGEVNIG